MIGPWLLLALVLAAPAAQAQVMERVIEARAACITHEGGDLSADADGAQDAPGGACASPVLDGTTCTDAAGAAERACLVRETAIWDGVLDRLVAMSADRPAKQAPVRGAVAAFRGYRDKACAAFQDIAVNPLGESGVGACRLAESARFAKALYEAYYSP